MTRAARAASALGFSAARRRRHTVHVSSRQSAEASVHPLRPHSDLAAAYVEHPEVVAPRLLEPVDVVGERSKVSCTITTASPINADLKTCDLKSRTTRGQCRPSVRAL